jgi:hypothetical protein
MSDTMQIDLSDEATRSVRRLADTLHATPEEVVRGVVYNGIQTLRRYARLRKGAETVDIKQVLHMLDVAVSDRAADPGDEIPGGYVSPIHQA